MISQPLKLILKKIKEETSYQFELKFIPNHKISTPYIFFINKCNSVGLFKYLLVKQIISGNFVIFLLLLFIRL